MFELLFIQWPRYGFRLSISGSTQLCACRPDNRSHTRNEPVRSFFTRALPNVTSPLRKYINVRLANIRVMRRETLVDLVSVCACVRKYNSVQLDIDRFKKRAPLSKLSFVTIWEVIKQILVKLRYKPLDVQTI